VQAPFVHTSIRTAEMAKYAANAYHALKVCFANEVADVCAALGADGSEVMRIFAMDRKLNVSEPTCGRVSRSAARACRRTLRAFLYAARAADVSVPMLASVLPSNEGQVRRGVDAVLASRRQRVGVVGLSFKAARTICARARWSRWSRP
jgi:GDP-mannose 6-dehydrogenase